ncbi:hypothetical protein QL285_076287 [Trifolium repens]|nr:hypothetical protein QL285_076287 [Trifolium repens]
MTASSQTLDSKIAASQTGASSLLNCSSQNRLTLNRSIGCLSNPKELQKLTQKFLHSKKVTNPKVLASAALGERFIPMAFALLIWRSWTRSVSPFL